MRDDESSGFFLRALLPDPLPAGAYVYAAINVPPVERVAKGRFRQCPLKSIDEAESFLAEHAGGSETYVATGVFRVGEGRKQAGVVWKRSIGADIDFSAMCGADPEGNALELARSIPSPRIIVATGRGFHVHLPLPEDDWFETFSDPDDAVRAHHLLGRAMRIYLESESARRFGYGVSLDHCHGVERLWRVPASFNAKSTENPKLLTANRGEWRPVSIVEPADLSGSSAANDLAFLQEYLEAAEAEAESATHAGVTAAAMPDASEQPFDISLLPEAVQHTWPAVTAQGRSESEHDYALACILRREGAALSMAVSAIRARRRALPPGSDRGKGERTGYAERTAKKAYASERTRPAHSRTFDRGDHAELADALIEELAPHRRVLVYADGSVHRYDAGSGLWAPLADIHLRRVVKRFAGSAKGDATLRVGLRDANGGVELAKAEIAQPNFFDDAPRGIAFENGFISLTDDGELHVGPHDASNRARWSFPFRYEPEADALRWQTFLDEVFRGDADAAAKQALLQEFAGAALFGLAPVYQKVLLLIGRGANGKNVTMDALLACFPDGSTCAIAPQTWGDEYRAAMLAGKRLNAVSELPKKDILESEAFKSVVTGDLMTARHIRQAPFTFRPCAGHILAANQLPTSHDPSHGYWRRLEVITYNRVFEEQEQEHELAKSIVAAERPAIVSWMVAGLRRLANRGRYEIPESSTRTMGEWRRHTQPESAFLAEQTDSASRRRDWTSCSDLHGAYAGWCATQGVSPIPLTEFGKALTQLTVPSRRARGGTVYALVLRRGETS